MCTEYAPVCPMKFAINQFIANSLGSPGIRKGARVSVVAVHSCFLAPWSRRPRRAQLHFDGNKDGGCSAHGDYVPPLGALTCLTNVVQPDQRAVAVADERASVCVCVCVCACVRACVRTRAITRFRRVRACLAALGDRGAAFPTCSDEICQRLRKHERGSGFGFADPRGYAHDLGQRGRARVRCGDDAAAAAAAVAAVADGNDVHR